MKRVILTIAALILIPGIVMAYTCSDLTAYYNDLILRLEADAKTAISMTTDPDEQTAIWASYELQKAQLEAERDATLLAATCTTGDDTTDNNNDGGGDDDPVVDNPNDPTDPDFPENPGNDDNATCESLMAGIKAEAQRLAAEDGRGFSAGAKYVHSRKAEIEATCGNFGRGRHLVGGNPRTSRH